MTNIFLTFLIPFVIAFFAFPLVERIKFTRNLALPLKFSFSLAFGITFLILFLSLWGMIMPSGFKLVSILCFILFLISVLFSLKSYFQKRKKLNHEIFLIKKLISNPVRLFIIIFSFLYLILILFHPVIDADVIDSYLTFGRSIVIFDKIPPHNFYDNRPFIIPPVGGPVLFAFFYSVSGSLTSEVFRLINLPFFIGFLIMSFYILKDYVSNGLVISGVLIIMTIPFLEDFIFTSALYPDLIFSFLSLIIFWMVNKTLKNNKIPYSIYIFLGLFLSASIFIKYQAFFLYILVFVTLAAAVLNKWRFLLLPIIFTPLILSKIMGSTPFQSPDTLNNAIFLIILLGTAFNFLIKIKNRSKLSLFGLISLILVSMIGLSVILRSYAFYGGLKETGKIDRNWALTTETAIGVGVEGNRLADVWSFFLSPALALVYLIPKITGLFSILSNQELILPFFIFSGWYSYWVLYLGSADFKWLLPIFPYITLVILKGLEKLFKRTVQIERFVIISILFYILSSKFIFWNMGIKMLGSNYFRKTAISLPSFTTSKSISSSNTYHIIVSGYDNLVNTFKEISQKIIYLLTSRSSLEEKDLLTHLLLALIFFLITLFLKKLFVKYKLFWLVAGILLITYSFVYLNIGNGNIFLFPRFEYEKVFDYWGQNTHVVPYLKDHAHPNDKILIFSKPSGLSYYTNLRVYNLEYGGGLSMIYPIFLETDPEKTENYFKDMDIKYILIRNYQESAVRFDALKKQTHIFDILNDPKYTKQVLSPVDGSYWSLYEII